MNSQPRVVIIGGGVGRLYAARGLAGGSRRYRSGGGVLHFR
jgi:NADH dehydrogenase FAD-containing subunit